MHSLSGGQLSLSAQWNIPEDKLVGENEHGSLTEMCFEEAKQNTLFSPFFFFNMDTIMLYKVMSCCHQQVILKQGFQGVHLKKRRRKSK